MFTSNKFEENINVNLCPYCQEPHFVPIDDNASHPIWLEMKGIRLVSCDSCGSHYTSTIPSDEFLAYCYATYSFNGYPIDKSTAKPNSRQSQAYGKIIDAFRLTHKSRLVCMDIGSGEAHLAIKLIERYPSTTVEAVDFAQPPQSDAIKSLINTGAIKWTQTDINRADYGKASSYDLITAVALIEHIKNPTALVQRIISLLKPGGKAYVLGPRAGSFAQIMFRKRWVYHIPGEHLSVPTMAGIHEMMKRIGHTDYVIKPIPTYYSTKYLFNSLVRKNWNYIPDVLLPLPTGSFSLEIRKS